MASKKSFVLRIDPEVYNALEKWAADEFRSINGQIEYIIHQSLKSSGRHPAKKTKTDSKSKDKDEND